MVNIFLKIYAGILRACLRFFLIPFKLKISNSKTLPLLIHCEIMQTPFYFDTPYGCEIEALLLSENYICIRRFDEHFRGGMPVWCDSLYIPNILDPNGLKIIENRVDSFILLAEIYRFKKLALKMLSMSENES